MRVLPEITEAYDRRQSGRLFLDEERVINDFRYRVNFRVSEELPPAGHISAAHCLAYDGDLVVLTRHVTREWTIPGGRLEPGETSLACMHREAREEAGIEVTDGRVVAHNRIEMLEQPPADWPYRQPSYQVFYVARLVAMGEITALDECTEARLFTIDEAKAAPGWPQQHPEFSAFLLSLRP